MSLPRYVQEKAKEYYHYAIFKQVAVDLVWDVALAFDEMLSIKWPQCKEELHKGWHFDAKAWHGIIYYTKKNIK